MTKNGMLKQVLIQVVVLVLAQLIATRVQAELIKKGVTQ